MNLQAARRVLSAVWLALFSPVSLIIQLHDHEDASAHESDADLLVIQHQLVREVDAKDNGEGEAGADTMSVPRTARNGGRQLVIRGRGYLLCGLLIFLLLLLRRMFLPSFAPLAPKPSPSPPPPLHLRPVPPSRRPLPLPPSQRPKLLPPSSPKPPPSVAPVRLPPRRSTASALLVRGYNPTESMVRRWKVFARSCLRSEGQTHRFIFSLSVSNRLPHHLPRAP
jgi:hypothetical protein